ncbi:flagellar protein FlaJ [Halogranum gelatinilyticum]|uniref:Flagellar protein FlaJ n=1 Tax=Halogranum gelatinilyticum TaxID=660521 RepID=A0A1G9R1Z9_9EURY|nr:type II secretion system F family protein [Halogranum gelatinilyticum]SDM17332.1 flagellar protein FlaJ [Halogranum gelatinilyticum]
MLWVVPLAVAAVLCLVVVLDTVDKRIRLAVTRVALALFGDYVVTADDADRRQQQMRAAHIGVTHRVYAARTLLYSGIFGVVGSLLGIYLAAGLVSALSLTSEGIRASLPSTLGFLGNLAAVPSLDIGELFVLLLFASATVGTLLAAGSYYARWFYLDQLAVARASAIEATLPRTVAFVYALSRSGMSFPQILQTLVDNRQVYGASATEIGVAVRDMDTFGTDVITALQRLGRRTPSDGLEEFSENLASVLSSGRSLSDFLHAQYERYQEEAQAQQEQYLELLATFAEVYVTVLVAGPLFFITILIVIGLVLQDTLTFIRFISYLGIPLASAAFIVYIDSMANATRLHGDSRLSPRQSFTRSSFAADGGVRSATASERLNRRVLATYDRLRPVKRWLDDPMEMVLRHPLWSLTVTAPVGLAYVALQADLPGRTLPPLERFDLYKALDLIDDPLVHATILVLIVFSLAYEARKRRLRAMEMAIPDFLDRLASVNEAGLTVVQSVKRVSESDLGALTPEVRRAWRDIQWGADAERALLRMAHRTSSPTVIRAATLITNAMRATDDIAPVLRIAADEAQSSRRLRRERRNEMVTYLLVIYISFFVFIGIIAALTVSFLPAIEATQSVSTGAPSGIVSGGVFSGIGDVDTDAYRLLLYHTAVIQAVCSGLIAGQLGEGTVSDGAKHAAILLTIAHVSFLLM